MIVQRVFQPVIKRGRNYKPCQEYHTPPIDAVVCITLQGRQFYVCSDHSKQLCGMLDTLRVNQEEENV